MGRPFCLNGRWESLHNSIAPKASQTLHVGLDLKNSYSIYYGTPFSHLFTELQISPIEVHISAIELEISPIQLKISTIELQISPNRTI